MDEKKQPEEAAAGSAGEPVSRKDFLKKMGSLAGLALVASSLPGAVRAFAGGGGEKEGSNGGGGEEKVAALNVKWKEGDDILLRMLGDLDRALTKPREKRSWAMIIDVRKCVGCHACTVACKSENVSPPGVVYRRVLDLEMGKYPDIRRDFVPVLCNQCDNPPCVDACPVNATTKRPDGIVDMKYNRCIGCRACLPACPYGARQADFGQFYTASTPGLQEYEMRPAFEYRRKWPRQKGKSPIGNARKCHFCIHRIERGVLPACVATCIGKATYFGDLADQASYVAELIGRGGVQTLKEKLGTKPRVYYLGMEGVSV